MKTIAKKIYLALICYILYAPIVTLMVLSFNNTKTRSKWGGFTGKWYVSLLPKQRDYECIVHNTDHCIALCTDCNIDRYLCRTWHAGNEFKNAYPFYGSYKHPYAECRYRNRSIPDASLHCIPLHTWI